MYKQLVGIPMGANCAPPGYLFLHAYESASITRVELERGVDLASQFQMTFRLIDDVLSADNVAMTDAVKSHSEAGGMYPPELTLNTTSVSPSEVEFLGMRIQTGTRRFRLSVYDKRKSFPFSVSSLSTLSPIHI